MKLPWNKGSFRIGTYPDGTTYVEVQEFVPHITWRIENYADLWVLAQIKDVYDYHNKELSVTIPWLLEGQADRRFSKDQSSGLKIVLNFIKGLNFKKVTIFHPHNAEVVEAYLPNVSILTNEIFIDKVLRYLDNEDLILMSTDAGGFKPLMKLVDTIGWRGETFSASKSRKYENGQSILTQQVDRKDFKGKDILLIDDICVKGGTFIGLADMLRERNVGNIFLAVSHLTTLDFSPDLVPSFDEIFITDSVRPKRDLSRQIGMASSLSCIEIFKQ